ncbi:MAG: hypothetical protein R8J94_04910 [Acidimicrobiia bacterium]|nr:hypothetical protein [Acidimicrobiia bacterium]
MEITATTAKYAFILCSVGGAAAGLNLAVMELGNPPAGDSSEEVTSAVGSETVTSDTGEPMQVVVDVPVVVPDEVVAAGLAQQTAEVGTGPQNNGSLVPIGAAVPAVPAVPTSDTAAPTTAPPVAPVATVPAKALKNSGTAASSPAPTTAARDTTTTAAPRAVVDDSRDETTTTRAASTTRATTTTRAPSTTEATTTTRAPSTTEAVAATQYLYYEFPGVASQIIVAQHGDGSLEFWSVTPEPGWGYFVEDGGPHEVELEFEGDGDGEAEWKLEYDDGDLRVRRDR